ncbi:MAG: DUF4157 domain-containing protein [Jatrophihabitantaceae bacterium]
MTTRSDDHLLDQLAAAMVSCPGGGEPLPGPVRRWLERGFDTDLAAVRVRTDPAAARLAALLNARAFTSGRDIYFAAGAYQPDTAAGRFLIAHEVAHVIQQAAGVLPPGRYRGRAGDRFERDADEVATRLLVGIELEPAQRGVRVPATGSRPLAVQCHDSFEHRALGDLATADLRSISDRSGQWADVVRRQIQLLWLWHQNPEAVTEQQVTALCPWIRTLRLPASGLLVTYGELNALPDYIATAATADTIDRLTLLPILQFIRQEGYIQLNKLLGQSASYHFADSVYTPNQLLPGLLNTLLGSQALDTLTSHLGSEGTDHYSALLGRNACHFAPFSWYRWQSSYLIARDLASKAHQSSDPATKAQLAHQAWIQVGYADHFLQDSFAAGHLVNKTMIMQWFIEWAAGQSLVPVADWDIVKRMTSRLQPGLMGRQLYGLDFAGPSNDPQTSEDLATYDQRRANIGLVVGESGNLAGAYQDYLSFMSSLITQSSSAAIHDYYNSNSLWVASVAHPEPYEVWGDDTLLSGSNGGEGVSQTSATSQLSQQSILELINTGRTDITPTAIRSHFPTKARNSSGTMATLEAWNETQRNLCGQTIFPGLHDIVVRILNPRIANISLDQDLATRWSASLPSAGYHVTSVLQVGRRVFSASNGYVYELDPNTGAVLHSLRVSDPVGTGDYETRLATDGNTLFVGVHGYVYGIKLNDLSRVGWTTSLPRAGYLVVEVCFSGSNRVYACSNGYLYELDPATGAVLGSVLLGSRFGTGDYTATLRMLGSSAILVGMHGYVYRINTNSFQSVAWEASLPNAGYNLVDVLIRDGAVYAGSAGYAYQLDLASGHVQHSLRVTGAVGVGDYTTTLAAGDSSLFVASHGYVYALTYGDWSRTRWTANLAGNRYEMANLASFAGQLVAGSYGYLYRIDPNTGAIPRSSLLASAIGVGDYRTRLVVEHGTGTLYVGAHGYSYRVAAVQH